MNLCLYKYVFIIDMKLEFLGIIRNLQTPNWNYANDQECFKVILNLI